MAYFLSSFFDATGITVRDGSRTGAKKLAATMAGGGSSEHLLLFALILRSWSEPSALSRVPKFQRRLEMRKLALSAALVMTATVALAQSATESTGVNSALGVAPKTEDFVLEASASDMFEIESSKLALQKGDDAVKTFAQQMISDHGKTSAELKSLIGTPVSTLTEDDKKSIDNLGKLEAADFNEEYIDEQVDAHEDAVDLFKRYSEEGDNPELKAWAGKTLPALQHHYMMAQQLDKK
jgi:putative membrane protein